MFYNLNMPIISNIFEAQSFYYISQIPKVFDDHVIIIFEPDHLLLLHSVAAILIRGFQQ